MKRHLLMHLWPRVVPYDSWRLTLREIVQRWELFDGVKCIAVATSSDAASIDEVRAELPQDADVFAVPNDPGLREVATFLPLMERVSGQPGATFFCHGKGSTHAADSICQEWARVMCETLLDHRDLIEHSLESYPLVGSFRRRGRFGLSPDNWHFSGTFYWFRNDAVFSLPDWSAIDRSWFGTESWPGRHFPIEKSGCVFLAGCADPYDLGYWEHTVRPRLKAWRLDPQPCPPAPPVIRCEFELLAEPHYRCRRCRKVVIDSLLQSVDHFCSGREPDYFSDRPGPARARAGSCGRLGAPIDEGACANCEKNVRVKIFQCSLHGRCSLGHAAGVRWCDECEDFLEKGSKQNET